MEAITFPDIEAALVDHLSDALGTDAATVSTIIPSPRPTRLVKITRTGGFRASVGHELAQITFDCWDDTGSPAAANLARLVRGHVSTFHGFVREFAAPSFTPDPQTDTPRYRMTVQIMQKSEVL